MKVDERFLQYVAFDTTSDEESTSCPSTLKQLKLAAFLKEEMETMGLSEVRMSEVGYVYGVLPASEGCEKEPVIGLIAHMDTSPAVSGADIHPQYVDYKGGDITLSDTEAIRADEFSVLKQYIGHTLITTDGTTLLGADDKAGIAEILSACEYLLAHPEIKHGKLAIGFTPDEEVGRGPESFEIEAFGADFAYTLDGSTIGGIEYECFNAASCKVRINGVSIHPGSAKNKMKNAVLIANELMNMMPPAETPAHTEGYEGFYHIGGISGNESLVTMGIIIRDHDRRLFEKRKETMENIGAYLNNKYGEGTVVLDIRDSYYNMREKLEDCMFVVERACDAFREIGINPESVPIRGGTDGATLSFRGLPCPNLSTGGENYHGVHEFVSVDDMNRMVTVITNIVKVK